MKKILYLMTSLLFLASCGPGPNAPAYGKAGWTDYIPAAMIWTGFAVLAFSLYLMYAGSKQTPAQEDAQGYSKKKTGKVLLIVVLILEIFGWATYL